MEPREEIERAVIALESQRAVLGDDAVDAALDGLRRKLAALACRQPLSAEPLRRASEGERKLVTVMFADLTGFTAMSERSDPESIRSLVNACFERLVPVVSKYGGTIDKFIGDEIMALFGAPEAHEDDPERALRAAIGMMDALAAFSHERGAPLGMHIGVNTGLAVAGAVGGRRSTDYSVMGDSVNLAARLAEAAERGQILVGADTYRQSMQLFDFASLQPLSMKGKERPVQAYRLLGLKAAPGPRRGLEGQGLTSPLVGRDGEYRVLLDRLERLRRGEGGIVSIIGEAGLGKTRLLAEARKAIAGEPEGRILWLEGQSVAFGESTGYEPFRQIIRQYAAVGEMEPPADAWQKLEASVAVVLPDRLLEILPALAVLLHIPLRDEYEASIRHFDGEAMGRRMFLAVRRLLEGIAGKSPLVLVLEDLHWMKESSVALLEHILPLTRSVPLLICCTSRPEAEGSALRLREAIARDHADIHVGIRLQPLPEDASGQLVRNLLSEEALPERLRERIQRNAEGNPFYLEEIIRTLIAVGAIVREQARDGAGSRWSAATDIGRFAIPDTIQGVIMARVDRLDAEAKDVLRTAAVIGRSFPYRVLRAVAGANGGLDRAIAELQRAELIQEKERLPELSYSFTHALGHEATYGSILIERRKELHARVAASIQELEADRIESRSGVLAYHYARAEQWDKALRMLQKAGDQAGRLAADAEALASYREAIDCYARAFGDRWDPLERAILERKMGQALYLRGEHEKAKEYLLRALDLLGCTIPRTDRRIVFAILRELMVQSGHRIVSAVPGGPAGRPASPVFAEVMANTMFVCSTYGHAQPLLSGLMILRALNRAEQEGSPEHRVLASAGLGFSCLHLGLKKVAAHYLAKALAAAQESTDPTVTSYTYYCLGVCQQLSGDWNEATGSYGRALDASVQTGNTWMTAGCVVLPLSPRRLTGDLTRALEELRASLPAIRDSGDLQALATLMSGLAHGLHYSGPVTEALACYREAVRLRSSRADPAAGADQAGELGFIHLRMGMLDDAIAALEEVVRQRRRRRLLRHISVQPIDALALAYLTALEQTPPDRKREWLAKARWACKDALRQGKVDVTGLCCALRFRARLEWLRGRPRAARRFWRKGLAQAARLGAVYETGMIELEMGERLRDARLLREAEAILDKAGAILDRDIAREALRATGGAAERPGTP